MKASKEKLLSLTYGAIVAALYVALTWISNLLGLASGAVQLRLGEALCVLPFFLPSTSVGLFLGCLISNLTMSCAPLDIALGPIATIIGAYLGSKMKSKWLVPLPTVLSNTIIVPFVIIISYTNEALTLPVYSLTALGVFIGEVASAYVIGMILLLSMEKHSIFKNKKR